MLDLGGLLKVCNGVKEVTKKNHSTAVVSDFERACMGNIVGLSDRDKVETLSYIWHGAVKLLIERNRGEFNAMLKADYKNRLKHMMELDNEKIEAAKELLDA